MTRVVHDDSPAPIVNTAPTDATTWSRTLSHTIRSSTLRKNAYLGRALSSLLTDGMHLGLSPRSMMMHSLYSPPLHPRLYLQSLRMLQSIRSSILAWRVMLL